MADASFTHNSVCTQISNMEADCQDVKRASSSNVSSSDQMQQLFGSLSAQISAQTDIIQMQIQKNDTKLILSQAKFKEEVRQELVAFRAMLVAQQGSPSHSVVG